MGYYRVSYVRKHVTSPNMKSFEFVSNSFCDVAYVLILWNLIILKFMMRFFCPVLLLNRWIPHLCLVIDWVTCITLRMCNKAQYFRESVISNEKSEVMRSVSLEIRL